MAFGIYMSDAFELYNRNSGETMNITYRKQDGTFGKKDNVKRLAGKGLLKKNSANILTKNIKPAENRNASKWHLVDEVGNRFEIWACLLISVDEKLIDKRH
jgi:hypothetical protein